MLRRILWCLTIASILNSVGVIALAVLHVLAVR